MQWVKDVALPLQQLRSLLLHRQIQSLAQELPHVWAQQKEKGGDRKGKEGRGGERKGREERKKEEREGGKKGGREEGRTETDRRKDRLFPSPLQEIIRSCNMT